MTKDITDDLVIVYVQYTGMSDTYLAAERHRADKKSRDSGSLSDFFKGCDEIDRQYTSV